MYDDRRDRCERFSVIDYSWATVQTNDGGKRWLQTWIAAPAFERFHQCAFLTADVCTSATMHDQVQAVVAAKDIFADVASGVCFFDSPLDLASCQCQFATNVNKGG